MGHSLLTLLDGAGKPYEPNAIIKNDIGVELDTDYCRMAASRLMNENTSLIADCDGLGAGTLLERVKSE